MPFPPEKRDYRITLNNAKAETKRFRDAQPANATRGGAFPSECFEAILKQPGCKGIRIYYGKAATGEMSLVMVGVDDDGNDMTSGEMIENHFPCPPFCDKNGELGQ